MGRKEFSHGVSLVLVYIHSKKSSFLSRSLLILHISKMHFHLCFTDQKYLKLELMKTSVNGEYQKRCRSLNQMTFTLYKRNTFMWDIVKKVRWQDFYHGQFVVQAKNLLQGDSPPVDLYLICEKSIWKSLTYLIFSQFQNCFLQAKNPVCRT